MLDALARALNARADLLTALDEEGTDIVRLLHGATEGAPGLTIDRYGPLLLLQTWREPLSPDAPEAAARAVEAELGLTLVPVWNHRGEGGGPPWTRFHDPERHRVAPVAHSPAGQAVQ